MGLIYCIKNKETNKYYIGKTIRSFDHRINEHFKNALKDNTNNYFYNAIKKYGKDTFDCFILEDDIHNDELNGKEMYYIGKFNSYYNGYNSTLGGDGINGFKHTAETKSKIGEAAKGRTMSEESKELLRNIMTGRKQTYEHKQNILATRIENGYPMQGKTHSEETKKKMSDSHKDKIITDEEKERLRKLRLGTKITDEHKTAISKANRKPKEKVECPHCGKIGGKPQMVQWHFNNCKLKETTCE